MTASTALQRAARAWATPCRRFVDPGPAMEELAFAEGFSLLHRLPRAPDAPCVGCGWCCLTDPCEVSHHRYGYLPRCPDLRWDAAAGRYLCGMMGAAEQGREQAAAARRRLFEGQGCCAPHNPFRRHVRDRG